MINNSVNPINTPNNIIITDQSQTNVSVTQPITTVLEVGAVGPQGQKGDTGPQGPQGDPGPQGPPGSLEAFEGIIVTGSSIFSGSTEFTNLPTIQVTGSFEVTGSASLNGYGLLTTAFTSSYNTFTASYYTDSSSFNTRVTNLEAFSSSLDATFATEAELNAATASLSASISSLSASYLASSASFDTRILNNSASIAAFSGSYLVDSASFNTRILNNSSSISSLSSSFVSFSGSYNTGSFTGSFAGNGAGLTNIPASGIVGLNLSQIASGSATASISPTDGFRVNTNSTITGSLLVTNGITGSLLGTASYAVNALTSSYAVTASYAENAGSGTQIATGSVTASVLLGSPSFQVVSSSVNLLNLQQNKLNIGLISISSDSNANIYIGSGSLGNGATGAFNTIIGGSVAGKSLTTGIRNTGVGRAVFENLTIGSSNTAIGDESARNITSGNGHTLIGKAAGFRISEGTWNTTLGELSGFNNSILLTGSFNTFLGANTQYTDAGISYATAIGQGAFVNQSYQFKLGTDNVNIIAGTGSENGKFTLAGTGSSASGNIVYIQTSKGQPVFTIKDDQSIQFTGSLFQSGSFNIIGGITGSLLGTASYSTNASYSVLADTASFLPSTTNLNISSISASNAYFQSASIGFLQTITGSATVIGDAFIILNTATPTSRYAGIIVEDSGSNPVNYTASFFFDSVTNDWNYEYSSSTVPNYGVALFGPEYLTKGSPSYPAANVLQKGNGGHHLLDSSITDDGTTVTISASVVITGSLQATGGISGSFSGSGANLFNIPASGITGLNLSQIATGSVTASVSPGTGSFRITSGSSTLLFVSSSGRVGIGTTTPASPLEVVGNLQITNNGGLTFYNANSIFSSHYITTNNEVLTATSNNVYGAWKFVGYNVSIAKNLAVGTTLTDYIAPSQTFLVSGSTVLRGNTAISGSATNSLIVRGSGTTNSTNGLLVQSSAGTTTLEVTDGGTVTVGGVVGYGGTAYTGRASFLVAGGDASSLALRANNYIQVAPGASTQMATFTTSGVRIGSWEVPTALLHITGSTSSALLEIDSPSVNNILFVTGSGRVGIGTGNPLYPLDVNGTVRVSGSGIILSSPPATTISISKEHIGGGSTSTNLNWVYDTLYVSNSSTGNLFFFNGYYGTVSVRTNTGQAVNAFGIKGLGTTSATNALQVYNSAESSIFIIKDSGNVGIGITTPTSSLHVAGTTIISASASTSSAALQVYKSGSTVVDIQGSSGQLFSVTDSLTGSLFSVNTVAGLPVIEAFSDNTVNIGKYGVYPIKVAATGTLAVITGSFTGSLIGVANTASFALTASYVNPLTQSVSIRGTGTTSATTALSIQNAGATSSLIVFDNGFVGIGTGSAAYNLDVNGGAFNNAFRVTGIARFTGASNSTGVYIENGLQIGSTISLGPFTFAPYMNITANSVSTNWGTVSFNTNNINAGEPSIILTSSPTNKGFTLGSTISGSSWATMKYFYDDGSMILQYTASSIDRVTSSIFTLNTTTRGFLPPRTNLTSNISTPAQGLITYITASSTEGLYYYNSGSFQSWTKVLNSIGTQTITGSLSITGSAGTGSALTVYKSGSTVVSIQGSQGELFSITDSLSGSLFSVSNISGLPILEVFSDNTTLIGNYLDPMLVTTQLVTANSGSTVIYSLPTASYDGAFYDYVIRSGSNSRAGQIMSIWSGSSVNYVDNSTTDFGSTAGFIFGVIVSGSNLVLTGSATTNSWTVKTIIRSI